MSPRRAAEQAEIDRQENDAADALANSYLALVERKEQERRGHLTTYRELVMRAADGNGQLPQSDIERLVDITRTLDLSVDDFSADVAAVHRDREHENAIAALVDQRIAASREYAAAVEEEEQLLRDWAPVRDEYETRRRAFDERISKVRRTRERAEQTADRFSREASKRGDRQTYARSDHRRVWGPL